jgi:hypothetical protein
MTRELVKAHGIDGLPSRHLRCENWLDDRDAIRSVCLSDPRLNLVRGYWAVLGDRIDAVQDDAEYTNAWQPWTTEEDERLRTRFENGLSVSALARELGRTDGAIRSRLARLGLIDRHAGRGVATPSRIADARGSSSRRRQAADKEDRPAADTVGVRAAWLSGVPLAMIASSLGSTDRAIEALLVRDGLVRSRTHARVLARASKEVRAAAARDPRNEGRGPTIKRVTAPASQPRGRVEMPEPPAESPPSSRATPGTEVRRVPAPPIPIAGTSQRTTPCPHGMPRDVCKACNPNRYIPTVAEGRFRRPWR